MTRKYHRHVGGKAHSRQAEFIPRSHAMTKPGAPSGHCATTNPHLVIVNCCPDIPPWEECVHSLANPLPHRVKP